MRKKVLLGGFSLLEVSISLLVIGIISSVGISQMNSILKLNATQKTQSNIDMIVRSLGAYYLSTESKIPFPSSDTINLGVQNEGIKKEFGIVPFKSLGIMEKFAKNGNGKWLLYKMNPFFCKKGVSKDQASLGVKEFVSDLQEDKVAIIIKSVNKNDEDEVVVWYSEKNFIANFANNKQPQQKVLKTGRDVAKVEDE